MLGLLASPKPKLEVVAKRFCGKADFGKNLGDLAEGGNFSIVDPTVLVLGNFPSYRQNSPSKVMGGSLSQDLEIVSLGRIVTFDEATEAFDNEMVRPAELAELVALGVCFPEEQIRGRILTLIVSQKTENRMVPGLGWTKELGRGLFTYRCEKFPSDCRFAVVRIGIPLESR